jgi:hypothetical protein
MHQYSLNNFDEEQSVISSVKLGETLKRREYQQQIDVIRTERKIYEESIFDEPTLENIYANKNDEIIRIIQKKKKVIHF